MTRFIVGTILLSHGTRKDVWAGVLFDDEMLISFEGWGMRNVRPDEQSLSGILRAGLRKGEGEEGGRARILQGVTVKRSRLSDLALKLPGKKYYFEGPGCTHGIGPEISVVFTCGGASGGLAELLGRSGFEPLRIGAREVPVDQAAVILNNALDRSPKRG